MKKPPAGLSLTEGGFVGGGWTQPELRRGSLRLRGRSGLVQAELQA